MSTIGILIAAVIGSSAATGIAPASMCKPAGQVARLADLPEASGLAASRVEAGRLWVHNDSGRPELFAVDASGRPQGRVTLRGVKVDDWEAMAIGPCGSQPCLFVGDIGDNDAKRAQITVYRVAEPAHAQGALDAEAFHAVYPDGAHDAETLLVAEDGTMVIVTKGDTGHIAAYRFPRSAKPGATVTLERIGQPLDARPSAAARVTDGTITRDGAWVLLRTEQALMYFDAAAFLRGEFEVKHRVDLTSIGEPQGEAVAAGAAGTIYLGGEGGSKKQPGTLSVLSCKP